MNAATTVRTLEVERTNLRSTRVATEDLSLDDGDVLMAVDEFAITSNNVTYGVAGDMLGYWNFFPPKDGDEQWGRLPAFGHGMVEASAHEGVQAGDKFYGYWPMASHVILSPGGATDAGFSDTSEHRQAMSPVYNRYSNTANDALHAAGREAQRGLLHPLFMTAFVADDYYGDHADPAGGADGYWGAEAIVISSASSKTSIGVAYQAAQRSGLEVVGLTSEGNRIFVESLGCFDVVLTYDEIAELSTRPTVYSDMSGSGTVREAVHGQFGDQLLHSSAIGITHWDSMGGGGVLAGPSPEMFFAPSQIIKRADDWGPGELDRRLAQAWHPYSEWTDNWLTVVRHGHDGGDPFDDFQDLFSMMLDGGSHPSTGHVVSLGG